MFLDESDGELKLYPTMEGLGKRVGVLPPSEVAGAEVLPGVPKYERFDDK